MFLRNACKFESGRPLFLKLLISFGGFSLADLVSTRMFLHSGGVESFWGALCAEIGPSKKASRAKHLQKRLSESSRCQIQLLREFSMVVSKASGALCAPRSGCHDSV